MQEFYASYGTLSCRLLNASHGYYGSSIRVISCMYDLVIYTRGRKLCTVNFPPLVSQAGQYQVPNAATVKAPVALMFFILLLLLLIAAIVVVAVGESHPV